MKISYNWLKEYINTDKKPEEIAVLLTDCGLEVESIEKYQSVKGDLEGVLIGEVLTKTKHPDADKLSLTTVNVGDNRILEVVCGAPNVEAGQKVVVATVGTTLYKNDEPLVIKKAKIRGALSEGMICAEDELGLGTSHDGIMILESSAKVGMTAKEYFNITDDVVFEIGLTPNRSDATSHIGIARDLYAVLTTLSIQHLDFKVPSVDDFKVDSNDQKIDVVVEDTAACIRYTGIEISGFEIKDSPDWLKSRLKAVGVRPINNIVDITNYVMLETGEPLHAFDIERIHGNKVIVKKLKLGTKFITLDGVERELTGEDLMICNANEGMCIAGVFGGLHSGITNDTKALFLESANFSPTSVRKTSKHHNLSTDSAFRFERGADPNITVYAIKRAANLIKQIAGGKITSDIIDIYPNPLPEKVITISYDNIDRIIGKKIDRKLIKSILNCLGITYLNETPEGAEISVPAFKTDVTREIDITEEILRIYGYNNIDLPDKVRLSLNYSIKPDKDKIQNLVSDYLSSNCFYEIYCNSLTKADTNQDTSSFVKILNPVSNEVNAMRQSLLYGGLETIVYNRNRKHPDMKFYEFGNSYHITSEERSAMSKEGKDINKLSGYNEKSHLVLFLTGRKYNETWKTNDDKLDIYDIKYYVQNILNASGINSSALEIKKINEEKRGESEFENGLIYFAEDGEELLRLGQVNSEIAKAYDIKASVYYADINWNKIISLAAKNKIVYKELPKYPEVRRDLALLIDKNINYADIEKTACFSEKLLIKKVELFDVYEGDRIESGKKSYAISFILQDNEKTLTDKVVDAAMDRIKNALIKQFNATIR